MTDFRSLCARMADELDYYRQLLIDDRRETHALATEARAALSEPEPVPVSERLPGHIEQALIKAECALADIAEGGTEYEAGESQVDPLEWAEKRAADALARIRPVMRRHQIQTSEWPPLPAHDLPLPGEVAELVSSLRSQRANYLEELQRLERYEKALSAVMPPDFKDWWENSKDEWPDIAAGVIENLRKREELAWEQAERLGRPQPVPVSERLPGPGDCIPHPRTKLGNCCWGFGRLFPLSAELPAPPLVGPRQWTLMYVETIELECSHWLPAHALPLPGEVEHG